MRAVRNFRARSSQGARQLLPELRARRRDLDSAIQAACNAGARELLRKLETQLQEFTPVLACRPSRRDPASCASAVPRQTCKIAPYLSLPSCMTNVLYHCSSRTLALIWLCTEPHVLSYYRSRRTPLTPNVFLLRENS